jgi:cysteine synthase B
MWAKLEGQNPTGSLKDRIAKAMVEAAEASGELTPGRTILEPTSGNTGIALAMVARRKGYGLTVVIPDNASEERIRLLELFGAEIVLSPGDKGTNGSIEIARRLAKDDRYFMPFQYGNPANPRRTRRAPARRSSGTCPRSRTSSPVSGPAGPSPGSAGA